ncbi:LuxR C-terminal-related transcriptional regulator [Kitasatospora sp. NBC_01287]|uniref:helix-turn-helix transcriptional regulator n=1 Tax=Kitasatospora sp. NBC_01287 TaxID=2903573 RepID=UPI002258D830|nr:LuxR family transcriptional regulator [Kitasatospora sp. NBC_01287]MCX4751342.1 LuxR C-terminal-related transcriptional regulator [Kitasatospora sp. NBC_01287]
MLEMLGLDSTTEAVYRQMLATQGCGIADLRSSLGLPDSAVRKALDQLADLTLVRASRDTPGSLRPVSPEVGLELILRRQEEELARRQQELNTGKATAARLIAEYATLQPEITTTENSERLMGLDAIQDKLETLTSELTAEILSVMPGGAQSRVSLDAARPLDADALGRGVRMQTLYQVSARNDRTTLAYAEWLTEHGGLVRTATMLPPRMLVFDRKVAVIPVDPSNTKLGALCTREPGILAALIALFEHTWETAVPLGADPSSVRSTGLNSIEKELLRLLATGLTDEAAGKRLGVSLRTVRRQMAAIMERLEATSRFEAGLKAAQRGWL